jgi:hypothetical protein
MANCVLFLYEQIHSGMYESYVYPKRWYVPTSLYGIIAQTTTWKNPISENYALF